MGKQEFPKMVFWPDGTKAIAATPDALDAMPSGWAETPAAFDTADIPQPTPASPTPKRERKAK